MFHTTPSVVDLGLIKDFNYMKNMLPSCPVLSINIFFTEILNTMNHLTYISTRFHGVTPRNPH